MIKNFKYVDAKCGSGKTHQAIEYIKRSLKPVILVQPLSRNLNETYEKLKSAPFKTLYRYDGESCDMGQVVRNLIGKLNGDVEIGDVVITTHAAFKIAASSIYKKSNWEVIVDEVVDVLEYTNLSLTDNRNMICDTVYVLNEDDVYSPVLIKDDSKLKRWEESVEGDDQVNDIFRDTAKMLRDDNIEVFTSTNSFLDRGKEGKVPFFGLFKPDIFDQWNDITFMSANFTEQMIYLIWDKFYDVNWMINKDIQNKLRYSDYLNDDLLTIHYYLDNKFSPWTGELVENNNSITKLEYKNCELLKLIVQDAKKLFGGEESITVLNNKFNSEKGNFHFNGVEYKEKVDLDLPANTHVISSYVHGLNEYQHINNALITCALNYDPCFNAFVMEHIGLTKDEVRRSHSFASIHQAMMRTSLRNPDNKEPKKVIVVDENTTMFLQELFPNATVECRTSVLPEEVTNQFKSKTGRKRKWIDKTTAVKVANERARQIKAIQDDDNPLELTFYASCRTQDNYPANIDSGEQMIEWFRDAIEVDKIDKQNTLAVLPGKVKGRKGKSKRDVVSMSAIMFDCDNGNFTPEMFNQVFPDMRFCYYTTPSGNGRFRILIPFKKPIQPEAHKAILKHMVYKLRAAGYTDNIFDECKFDYWPVYNCPVVEKGDPNYKFGVFGTTTLDPEEYFINNKLVMMTESYKDLVASFEFEYKSDEEENTPEDLMKIEQVISLVKDYINESELEVLTNTPIEYIEYQLEQMAIPDDVLELTKWIIMRG